MSKHNWGQQQSKWKCKCQMPFPWESQEEKISVIYESKLREATFHLHASNPLLSPSRRNNTALSFTMEKEIRTSYLFFPQSLEYHCSFTRSITAIFVQVKLCFKWGTKGNVVTKTITKIISCASASLESPLKGLLYHNCWGSAKFLQCRLTSP